ncbi:cytochrome b/b6 domain-containing protein [Myroides sp. M-43]|uniref:cytochrome b/b6 domain-containing protein n=1 Tax=Myroides oncorhynchi TaxID=2893756 RepID=UPI001E2E9FF7|nr:cytochrome b/b6 domain-containing protein [Myroides oncorhynchi]MCC9042561.1 cytochrome b/b6 domain-containing protein [Myroides oncorhynchi]
MRGRGDSYSFLFRFLHWSIALVMIGLLVTILLRLTWLNKAGVSDIIIDYINSQGVDMTAEQAVVLAKRIRKPMWDWHIYLGYALIVLIFLRFVLAILGKVPFLNPFKIGATLNTRLKAVIYLLFYICVVISLLTGLIIEFDLDVLPKVDLKLIHKASIYYFISFLVIHFVGVWLAELSADNGIISRMINGKSKFDL